MLPDTTDDVESFSHLARVELGAQPCRGLACFVARMAAGTALADDDAPRVHCVGQCFAAPAVAGDANRPVVMAAARANPVLERMAAGGARTLDTYRRLSGYQALEQALAMKPEEVVAAVETSQLRGRGGAGYPAGRKWRSVWEQPAHPRAVVVNADEGDPGAYTDRFILEDDPFCVLEAMTIAAYAVSAEQGYVYVRREYPAAYASIRAAVEAAREVGLLGGDVGGKGLRFDVDVVLGKGSYVCGEETALLNALEGRRPEVRARPPFPSVSGLFARPTLVHNVETLANVPWILRHGAAEYAALGIGQSRGTIVLSLNSLFERPGLYEVELGTRLAQVLFELAGGLRTGPLVGVMVGGPLAGVLPRSAVDVPVTFEHLCARGGALGHGGVIAFDDATSILALAREVFRFGAYESCGKCTPCRVGTSEVGALLTSLAAGPRATSTDADTFRRVIDALSAASLCGHGSGLADFARSLERHFPSEVATWFG